MSPGATGDLDATGTGIPSRQRTKSTKRRGAPYHNSPSASENSLPAGVVGGEGDDRKSVDSEIKDQENARPAPDAHGHAAPTSTQQMTPCNPPYECVRRVFIINMTK